ncbi:hypothetical protein S40285_00990 [Stachybotrys chlorohalonatus IBT 40285]|uniref:Uncharacterized protein n=1 Tax=Stachybotrys chlorohalonatus (strain IBT 40285) TaxID=1283841 RepID=A0A084QUR1_STAC4|nr:hypothetical protein S40285_00990 [Stachybotrys chlorohalonata IBT 40285]
MPALSLVLRRATALLSPRQNADSDDFHAIPADYGELDSSPSPGVVAAIVIGSVAAFLVVLFLVYYGLNFGAPVAAAYDGASTYVTEPRDERRRSSRGGSTSRGPPRRRVRETIEVRTRERTGPVIVDAPPPPPVVMSEAGRSDARPPRMVPRYDDVGDDDDDDEDDEVVVIEEHSPPRRQSRRQSSRRRSPSFYSDDDRSGVESSYLSGTRSGRRSRY